MKTVMTARYKDSVRGPVLTESVKNMNMACYTFLGQNLKLQMKCMFFQIILCV